MPFFTIEFLEQYVPRQIELWKKELVTEIETVSGLLDHCAFTLVENPDALNHVAVILKSVPVSLLERMHERLVGACRSDGSWKWPLGIGVIAEPDPVCESSDICADQVRETANAQEEKAIGLLRDCLARIRSDFAGESAG